MTYPLPESAQDCQAHTMPSITSLFPCRLWGPHTGIHYTQLGLVLTEFFGDVASHRVPVLYTELTPTPGGRSSRGFRHLDKN